MAGPIHEFSRFPRAGRSGEGRIRRRRAERAPGAPPRVGVIYNAKSHRNRGTELDLPEGADIAVARPVDREEITGALAGFAADGIDLLVVHGGDGTVRDVLTCGQGIFGDDWPALAVLPQGKTNALTMDLGTPDDWSLDTAIAALDGGSEIVRRPLAIYPSEDRDARVLGFVLGAGAFTTGIQVAQGAHRMGAFNASAVGLAVVWGILQTFFGGSSNRWRRGVPLSVALGAPGKPLDHSGFGEPDRRYLFVASSLEAFPGGLKVFGKLRDGIKLAVIDSARRRLMAMLPLVLAGYTPKWLRSGGIHQLAVEGFAMEIGEPFILDGEAFPPGSYRVEQGPRLRFVVP